jgi:hypothetical protein
LCRVHSYSAPGLPSPTINMGGFLILDFRFAIGGRRPRRFKSQIKNRQSKIPLTLSL